MTYNRHILLHAAAEGQPAQEAGAQKTRKERRAALIPGNRKSMVRRHDSSCRKDGFNGINQSGSTIGGIGNGGPMGGVFLL